MKKRVAGHLYGLDSQRVGNSDHDYVVTYLQRLVLQAIRNSDHGLTDGQLDWVFGRTRLAPEREKILRQLEGGKLVKCSAVRGGGRLWTAVYPERNKGDQNQG